ncbi:MAG TPA: vWA domain-containing protein, partial [Polyangiaceae bacterium]
TGGSSSSGAAGTGTGGAAATGTGGAAATGTGGAGAVSGAATGGASTGGAAGNGNGGAAGAGAVPPGGDSGAGGQVACQDLTVEPTPLVPSVMILVDNSSSMYEPRDQLWDALYTALMSPTMGAVKPLEAKIRFGFASYRGPDNISVPETDNSCAQIESVGTVTQATVAPALNNHAAIDTVYKALGLQGRDPMNAQWETPTGHAVTRIATTLRNFNPDPPGPKYILLVTDGDPNTCLKGDPQCGQDNSLAAVQAAYTAGVGTFVVGIGDILSGCNTAQIRCGEMHLQDIANAGTGQPVQQPPADYCYQSCVAPNGGCGTLLATYAPTGGMSPYFVARNPTELQTKLSELLSDVVSCTIQLDATVSGTADPSLARITVGGNAVPYNTPDGWILESTRDKITLQGGACMTFRGGAAVNVVFPCSNGRPIGM